jgi:hypothetical protein
MEDTMINEEIVKIIKGEDVDDVITKYIEKYPESEGWSATPSVEAQADGKVKLTILFQKPLNFKQMEKNL